VAVLEVWSVLTMRVGVCGVALLVVALGSGCGASGPAAETSRSGGAGFPVEVADCDGNETTIEAAPEKIVTSNASGLEMLLWLGAGKRVLGTGFPPGKGTLPGELAEEGEKVPVLGDTVIPKEKLLGSGADLYLDTFADMGSMGGMGTAPTEEEFEAVGMKHVFVTSTACAAMAKEPMTDLSAVEKDVERLGAVTGTADRAAELVGRMRTTVREVTDAVRGAPRPSYFFFDYDAGTDQPMAVCGKQVANAVITLAGARNVYADCEADFKPVGWEDVVSKNPDWIQLGVRNRGSAEENEAAFDKAEQFLRNFPATAGLKAVKEDKFVRVGSEQTTISGVRNADTVRAIAATVHPDLVTSP
jgi:iron complex transport system substrate-binding protein